MNKITCLKISGDSNIVNTVVDLMLDESAFYEISNDISVEQIDVII